MIFLSIPDWGSPGQTEEDGAAAEIRQREFDGTKWRGQNVAWIIEGSAGLKWVHEQSSAVTHLNVSVETRALSLDDTWHWPSFDHICFIWNWCAWRCVSFGYGSYKCHMFLTWSVWCIWTAQLRIEIFFLSFGLYNIVVMGCNYTVIVSHWSCQTVFYIQV